ncbi:hypothetical protein J6590_003426 [Homalodisca vitripennis]|nr:hypothetical protein J6590_003426 [Homalodisca vitripennis]
MLADHVTIVLERDLVAAEWCGRDITGLPLLLEDEVIAGEAVKMLADHVTIVLDRDVVWCVKRHRVRRVAIVTSDLE